jgi:hypothetical protein
MWLHATSPFCDSVHEGVVVRSNAWDQPGTFKMQVADPNHPNPIIPLHRVHELKFISGEGSTVDSTIKTIKVQGSKGNVYTVTKVGDQWNCTCTGFMYRKACKHLDEARNAK